MIEIKNTRILYMEDDPGLARLLQKTLQRRGFVVDIAPNGEDGIAMMKMAPYDLLLVDYNMPFQDGLAVIRELTAKDDSPPAIMITGEGNETIAVEALKVGAADYLVKDADMKYLDMLPSVIDQVLLKEHFLKERQQMIELVKESEERYRHLFDSNPIPTMAYDLQSLAFLAVNNAAVAHYGYSREEFLSLTINDLYAIEDIPEVLRILSRLDQGAKQSGTWRHLLKDTSMIEVDITSDLIMLGGNRAHVILAQDISERKKNEESLLKTQKLESLAVLAGGLAHDFNNLLTAILGNIALAKLEAPPNHESILKYLNDAEKTAGRAQSLTLQLLTFSQGGAPLKKVFSLTQVIEDSAGLALSGSQSLPRITIPEDLWPVEADEGQIGQVLHNLIVNAAQSMPDGGIITVSAQNCVLAANNAHALTPGNYVSVSITDRGTGIPEAHLPKIFDPYFTTRQKHSGLGLATCYSVIKRHQGHITVESVPGKGSTFSIFLPARSAAVLPAKPQAAGLMCGSGRILVMDDEEIITDVTSVILARLGYEVVCAQDGAEAVALYEKALLEKQPFSLVIMDLTIPGGMGGKEAVLKLRELDPAVKAIVSSGYSNDPIMADFKENGFCGVVAKPYSLKQLSDTVHAVLSGRSSAPV